MSKVRSSGKTRSTKGKVSSDMMNDDDSIVNAMAKTLEMFSGKMDDTLSTTSTSTTKKSKNNNTITTEVNSMSDNIPIIKKEKKQLPTEEVIPAPEISTLTSLLPKMTKVERKVVGLNKEGIEMTKTRSKKDRLKLKQQALIDHITAANDVTEGLKKKKMKQTDNMFNFGLDFGSALDSIEQQGDKVQINPMTAILNGAGQWKGTKKEKKSLENDKTKFEQVLQHPAFQANSIGTLQQHLTNQMAMMKQIDQHQNGLNAVDSKVKRTNKKQDQKYNKLVKNTATVASTMKKK